MRSWPERRQGGKVIDGLPIYAFMVVHLNGNICAVHLRCNCRASLASNHPLSPCAALLRSSMPQWAA